MRVERKDHFSLGPIPPQKPAPQQRSLLNFFKSCCFKEKAVPVKEKRDPYRYRAQVFQETLKACHEGYVNSRGEHIKIDHDRMCTETVTYHNLPELVPLVHVPHYQQTQFSVITEDTFQVMLKRNNPVGINMANRFHAGGGVKEGCPAQEEALCRRSDHYLGLTTQSYPFPEGGGIYCPDVTIFREDEAHGYAFMDEPKKGALVAVAAYDLREYSSDRVELGLPLTGPLSESTLLQNKKYMEGTRQSLVNMLRAMALKGHTAIVLGALGCGAFQNPPQIIARLFAEAFTTPEFWCRFETVDFAILKIFPNDQRNVDAFNAVCQILN